MRAAVWILLVACACACPSKSTSGPTNGSAGSGSAKLTPPPTGPITTCDGARDKLEGLYRAEAQAKEPKRVDEAVADNTAMVMKDCNKAPARVVPCLAAAQTVAEIEAKCLTQLDDEGTEGDAK